MCPHGIDMNFRFKFPFHVCSVFAKITVSIVGPASSKQLFHSLLPFMEESLTFFSILKYKALHMYVKTILEKEVN